MSAPTEQPTPEAQAFIFTEIPSLKLLMPRTAGLPGVTYVQVTVGNQRKAQDGKWVSVLGSRVYSINGPNGRADMILMAWGKPIQGVGTESGARECLIDPETYVLTGFPDPEKAKVEDISKLATIAEGTPIKFDEPIAPKAPEGVSASPPSTVKKSVAASQGGS